MDFDANMFFFEQNGNHICKFHYIKYKEYYTKGFTTRVNHLLLRTGQLTSWDQKGETIWSEYVEKLEIS